MKRTGREELNAKKAIAKHIGLVEMMAIWNLMKMPFVVVMNMRFGS
jgi:hypothetical protein